MWNRVVDILSRASRQWKSILFMYATQLVLGIVVATTAYNQFDGAIGDSIELDRLARGFDRSIFSDMVNEFPSIIGQIQSRFIIIVVVFLLLSIFLHTGLLGNIRKRQYSLSSFFLNARKFFFRFLGVVIISLIKMVVTLAIIWVPFFKLTGNPLETFHSEKTFILTVIGFAILSALLVIIIWLWSILSRYHIVDGDQLVIAMKSGWRSLKAKFIRFYLVGIGLIALHIFVTWIYTYAVDDWGAETWFCVFGLVMIQQIFSIIRIWIRVFGYAMIED